MPNRRRLPEKFILNAVAAVGFGTTINVSDFQHVLLKFSTDSSANLTFKIQGSLSEEKPDFTAARSTSNHWDFVGSFDLNNPSSIVTGDVGFSVTGTDDVKNIIVNTAGLYHLNAEVTARSAGNVTLKVIAFDNA